MCSSRDCLKGNLQVFGLHDREVQLLKTDMSRRRILLLGPYLLSFLDSVRRIGRNQKAFAFKPLCNCTDLSPDAFQFINQFNLPSPWFHYKDMLLLDAIPIP